MSRRRLISNARSLFSHWRDGWLVLSSTVWAGEGRGRFRWVVEQKVVEQKVVEQKVVVVKEKSAEARRRWPRAF